MRSVYMDHSATTPVREEVVEAMMPYLGREFGNASSLHSVGRRAHDALEESRQTMAALLGASPPEIIITSGGTESDNLAIVGAVEAAGGKGHVITSAVEHHAVLNTCEALAKRGLEVTYLPVDEDGMVDPADLENALREDTVLVNIMTANNEVGAIEPIAELAAAAAAASVPFHTDAVQAAGKIPVDVDEMGIDMMSVSAHKFYGPKGVGLLYVRGGTRIVPRQYGGHHEDGRRAGTENIAGIVGMARALELACAEMDSEAPRLRRLRDRLQEGLLERVEGSRLNGHRERRLPHLLNVTFENVEGESVLLSLDALGIAVSTGSACSSGTLEPSHVLIAMGVPKETVHGSVRFSLGRINTEDDVDHVLDNLPPVIERLRQMSPFVTG